MIQIIPNFLASIHRSEVVNRINGELRNEGDGYWSVHPDFKILSLDYF